MTVLYQWLKQAADARGNNKALVYRDNYLSWRGLLHRVDRRAQEFQSMSLKKDGFVGLMLGNVPDFIILALALSKLDIPIIPIDPTTGTRELELMMSAAPLKALVTRPRGSESGGLVGDKKEIPREPSIADEQTEIRRRLQGTLLTCSVYKRESPKVKSKPGVILFTSDSAGDPKGVIRTSDNMKAIAEALAQELSITADSRILIAVPLFHAYGWDVGLLPTLKTGATMYVEEEISARRVGKLLRDHTIDVMPGTPSMYRELVKLPTAKDMGIKNTRYLSSGSKLEPEVAAEMAEKYNVKLISCYHTSETGPVSLDVDAKYPDSVGKVLPNLEIKFTSLGKKSAATAKAGAIWIKGPGASEMALGPGKVFDGRKKTEVVVGEMDSEKWVRTGDVGKQDKSGRLILEGREDDIVKVDGKRVVLGEVQGCIEAFPKVKAAQARLESDPFSGTMVVVRVVASSKCDPEEIIDHCARNLAPYKVPRRIEFCERI